MLSFHTQQQQEVHAPPDILTGLQLLKAELWNLVQVSASDIGTLRVSVHWPRYKISLRRDLPSYFDNPVLQSFRCFQQAIVLDARALRAIYDCQDDC